MTVTPVTPPRFFFFSGSQTPHGQCYLNSWRELPMEEASTKH